MVFAVNPVRFADTDWSALPDPALGSGGPGACAEIGNPARLVHGNQRSEQHGVHAGPVPLAPWLDHMELTAMEAVDGLGLHARRSPKGLRSWLAYPPLSLHDISPSRREVILFPRRPLTEIMEAKVLRPICPLEGETTRRDRGG